ncbi:MAG: dehydrogenase subunit [Acidobacteriales bacterium]|nr:dehydrogenase subunit [Terriglobales bacterium]
MSSIPAAITDIEELKDHPALSKLLSWRQSAMNAAKFDRDELSIQVDRAYIRDACSLLQSDFNFLSDVTCVDWAPSEPRFQVTYHLLSHKLKDRVRLQVMLPGDDPVVESIMPVWPAANFFEREIFDLFGVRFLGHPNMARIMMPEDWDGHPLRKDYPVEGYR